MTAPLPSPPCHCRPDPLGQTEIRDIRLVMLGHEDIRRLDVPVQDRPLMGVMNGACNLGDQRRGGAGSSFRRGMCRVRFPPSISFMLKYG